MKLRSLLLAGLPLVVFCAQVAASGNIAARADYAPVTRMLEPFIQQQMADKQLPALSIALVDDQDVVWAQGYGLADTDKKVPATAETVYRVGSVSKLFTDIAVMQQVERGKIDLDAPVSRYLPDFHPRNPFGTAITLRQLMSHRSGLVREPPVGNYFDPTGPTLAQTVASLNSTALVFRAGQRIKYSNAAIATVGYVLEHMQGEPFAKVLKHAVLEPLAMKHSSFEPEAGIVSKLAKGRMWTLDGREFAAPTFEIGISPAGSMYTTVTDLGRFISALFVGGQPVLKTATLQQMWTPQFAKLGAKSGFGIGFHLDEFEQHRRVGHNGAIYGFATSLDALPEDKLGVVVVTTMDAANAVTQRIADAALRGMLALRSHRPVPQPDASAPISPERARQLAGRYVHGKDGVELTENAGRLSMLQLGGGFPVQLSNSGDEPGDTLVTDGRLAYGEKIVSRNGALVVGKDRFTRIAVAKPAPAKKDFLGLIGEYGWDHDVLYVFEKDGRLWVQIEWFEQDPLTQVSRNEFRFPDHGFYAGEKLIFTRDAKGHATQVNAANVVFKRRQVGPEEGAQQLKITPLRPVDELMKSALAASPPGEKGEFVKSDLVELVKLDPSIKLDIRYAGTNNFLSTAFYSEPRAFMQRPAAEAVMRVQRKLKKSGYSLLIHDAYRPWYVTKIFWDATPEDKHLFVADPAQGSRHNRGAAVDLSLYDLKTGQPVQMVGTFDEISDRSYPDYPGGTSLQRWHRRLLRDAMESEGFTVYLAEWWHFDFMNWQRFPIANLRFDQIPETVK